MNDKKDRYLEIIKLSRPYSKKYPPMSLYDRAAQFAPFSALNGHSDKIEKAAKLNAEKI